MSHSSRLLDVFEGKRHTKLVLAVSVVMFLMLELLIYLAAAGQAGDKSRVVVVDPNGSKVYETTGTALTSYEKMVFETNYGPLRNYQVRLETESAPFPVRAWLSGAVGVPVGLVLLVAFLVRAYLSLLYGEAPKAAGAAPIESVDPKKHGFGSVLHAVHRISIFHVGLLVFVAVLLLWMVPNFLGEFVRIGSTAIRDYKWFFLGSAIFLALLTVWIIYLRYKLSKQMLDNQLDLEKFRLEKQLLLEHRELPQLISNPVNETQEP